MATLAQILKHTGNAVSRVRCPVDIQKMTCVMGRVWKETGEPSPLGKMILEHNHDMSNVHTIAFHAGPRRLLNEQMESGEIEDKGMDFYVGNAETAAHFGGREEDSVMLTVGACKDTPVRVNEQFQTTYFPGGEMGKVKVLSAREINPAWLSYVSSISNRTAFIQRVLMSVRAADQASAGSDKT